MEKSHLHLLVKGRVQGVFFRRYTNKKANELELNGFVKNLDDGSVEIVAEGEKEKLQALLTWTWKGSHSSRVDDVIVEWNEYSGNLLSFQIED